jgi:hypothetical protein
MLPPQTSRNARRTCLAGLTTEPLPKKLSHVGFVVHHC